MEWEKKEVPAELVKQISTAYGCDLLTASILVRRNITKGPEIQYFLEEDPRYLRNPYDLGGMEDAVERILAAKDEGEKVLIFGDRDVDGICASALLADYLHSLEMDITIRLPRGDEPYGLTIEAVEEFAAAYGTLIITVDCGITNHSEISRAAELGVDVIVTDHHKPQETIPEAYAVVNPKLSEGYGFKDLAGCGVAYKLVSALRFAQRSELYGQPICLLNTQPLNEAWNIEILKIRNLVIVDRLIETVVPGAAGIMDTRLPEFLSGQQILVWDGALQKQTLNRIFGNAADIYMQDIAPEIGKEIPSAAGKSLIRIKELSKTAKYADSPTGELEVFYNLFCSFIRQREKHFGIEDTLDLQLACLGTLADIMPLVDENRIIVRQGLKAIIEKPRPGLSDLLFKLELSGRRIGASDLSWQICPAINASGRMGRPQTALDLLMEKDKNRRNSLADELLQMNEERKKIGEEIWIKVEPLAEKSLEAFQGKMVLAFGEEIPRGVTGVMANRLMSRFKVPALVASAGDEIITASLRSLGGFDLHKLLEPLGSLFLDWGGHSYAAGFSIRAENWEPLLAKLKSESAMIDLKTLDVEPVLAIDAELPHSYLTRDIYTLVDLFEPYGEENGPLIFMSKKLKISELGLMGKGEAKHVKLSLDAGKHKWPAVYWSAAEKVKREFDLGDQVDAAFRVSRNWFKGNETPQLVISDIKRSSP